MLELKIQCEDADMARMYLNGPQYLCLLSDLLNALRSARKYGTDETVVQAVNTFYADICKAVDDSQGPY